MQTQILSTTCALCGASQGTWLINQLQGLLSVNCLVCEILISGSKGTRIVQM